MSKAQVTLGGIPLAGASEITWRFQAGTQPYVATMSAHRAQWEQLRTRLRQDMDLVITDARGKKATIQRLHILHEVASDSPNRHVFLVADRRWEWPYKLIARDYNIAKRSGDRSAVGNVPFEGTVTVDKYDYRPYSLNQGERWTARETVEDVLRALVDDEFRIESFPSGQLSIQNVMLRDSGDVALSRLLGYIPGAEVYIDSNGRARVFDASDFSQGDNLYRSLPPSTWDGDAIRLIDRRQIRPRRIIVHYQREVEALFDYQDDFGDTITPPNRDALYVENVIPTVEPVTELEEFEPEGDLFTLRDVGAGTFVEFRAWLDKMRGLVDHTSFEWTFETIALGWAPGKLEELLGVQWDGVDDSTEFANIAMRVEAIKQHFRQTFRVNRRYAERLRDILPYRVAVLDTVTGARAPAAVWAEACLVATAKGGRIFSRTDPDRGSILRNIYIPEVEAGASIATEPPSPALVEIVDPDQGIYRLNWITSPYGTVASVIPSNLVDEFGSFATVTRDLSKQLRFSMGLGIKAAGRANGRLLRNRWRHLALMTVVPAAPNNKFQFYRRFVTSQEVAELYGGQYRIRGGAGPDLEVFVPPTEMTARYRWIDDDQAKDTLTRLLGLDNEDPSEAGLRDDPETKDVDESQMLGYELVNGERELKDHALSMAAEALAAFADGYQGRIVTAMGDTEPELKGNVISATIRVGSAPGAKVTATHEFAGQQRPVSRFGLMPQSVRELVLGVLPFGGKKA